MARVTVRKMKSNPDMYEVCEGGKPVKMQGGNSFATKERADMVADARRRVAKKRKEK